MSLEVDINEYVAPATQHYLIAGGLTAFGIYCLGVGYWNHGAYAHCLRSTANPKSKSEIKKLLDARGIHRSGVYVKLQGTAEAGGGKLIKAALSGFDCVFVRSSYLGNRVRLSSDIQGTVFFWPRRC